MMLMDPDEAAEARRDAAARRSTDRWLARRWSNDGSWTPDDEADLQGWARNEEGEDA